MTAQHPQAAFLHALADHLDAHPELVTTSVHAHFKGPGLHVGHTRENELHLHAWAHSIGADHFVVTLVHGDEVYLEAHGTIGGHSVRAWGTTPNTAGLAAGDEIPVLTAGGAS